ncbi:hypothetical protein C823_003371 [Eubacterium plexicaudatum ASF492]|nr:hypothetical protein C823_003371 [Eubacterium plexicaudatum ASF492]
MESMEQEETMVKAEIAEPDIGRLSHELTYHKYLLNNDKIRSFLQKLSIPEYLAMHIIKESEQTDRIYAGRTYLKDIADQMQRSIRQTSRMVKALQERDWCHGRMTGMEARGLMLQLRRKAAECWQKRKLH